MLSKEEYNLSKRIGGLAIGKIKHERTFYEYYKNPNFCKFCGKLIQIEEGKSASTARDKKFCNHSCAASFNNIGVAHNPKKPVRKKRIPKIGRKFLINKYGEKCMKCGWEERNIISNAVPIQLHHIDGNDKNNEESNLILLCPNCHSLTPNYMFYGRKHTEEARTKIRDANLAKNGIQDMI